MARSGRRFGSILGAAALAAGGLTLVAAPASAQEFDGIATLDEFIAALDIANGNGEPDTITLALPAEETWTYSGTLPVLEDLTIQLEPGSATVTFHSSDDSAFLIGPVAFTATGVGFTGDGDEASDTPGFGINAAGMPDVVLQDVRLVLSADDGLHQTGGSLVATGVDAVGNGLHGLYLDGLDSVALTNVQASGNAIGVALFTAGGENDIERLDAQGNGSTGLWITATGGTVRVLDSRFDGNGSISNFAYGGAITVFAWQGAEVELSALEITNNEGGSGGGIQLDELKGEGTTLTVADSFISGNRAAYGGGIGSRGGSSNAIDDGARFTVTNTYVGQNVAELAGGGISVDGIGANGRFALVDSAVEGNLSDSFGAGLHARSLGPGAILLVDSSTIADNSSNDGAGGVYLECPTGTAGTMRFVDSTVSGNRGGVVGGFAAGCDGADTAIEVTNSTFTANESTKGGPVVAFSGGNVGIRNTIVGGNTGDADLEFQSVVGTVDYSLVQTPASGETAAVVAAGTGNITDQSPDIGPLADNGGPTRTHLPMAGGNVAEAGEPDFMPPPEFDQRGEPRVSGRLDIGSVELQRPPHVLPVTGSDAPWPVLALALLLLAGGALAVTVRADPRA